MNKFCLIILFGFMLFSSCKIDKTPKEMDYGGVSFQYPRSWSDETEDLGEGSYYITCEQKLGNDIITVNLIESEDVDLDEYFDLYFEEIGKRFNNLSTKQPKESKFSGYDCIQIDYTANILRESIYGSVFGFYAHGKSLFIVKQSDTENRLKRNFELIESSFKVYENVSDDVGGH